jgi:hypothetical protein
MEIIEKFNSTTNFREISNKSYWKISGIQRKCWDKNQQALFGSSTHKSSICYIYIPAEYMEENIPFIISSDIDYDGGKAQKKGVENGDLLMSYNDLKNYFTLNKFE